MCGHSTPKLQVKLALSFLIALCFVSPFVNTFNIDLRYPVIFNNNRGGLKTNYFGTSVSFLKSDNGASWIIIGAPKANSTLAIHSDIHEPGVIWQCSLGQTVEKCRPLLMDPTPNQFDGTTEERKDEGWLGGPSSLAMDSKNFVACANRWEKRENTTNNKVVSYMHGICYRRPRSDLFRDPMPPLSQSERYRLNPLNDPIYEDKKFWQNGQAGFSVHMPKTGNEILMGAPGADRWIGSLIQYLSRDGGETYVRSFVGEPQKNYPIDQIQQYNYLGYSLTSGYFSSNNLQSALVQYAAGAPRGNNLRGKVIIFQFPDNPNGNLAIQYELSGSQTGAYFGASLLALDINGDGYDDLLVGAPRFSRGLGNKLKLPTMGGRMMNQQFIRSFERFEGYGDEGAVYVFLSNKNVLSQKSIVHGDNRQWAQFGTAMISLGDMNKDGYNDFAISAPYEPGTSEGTGAVYIYHGSKSGYISKSAQIIRASDIDNSFRGFGFSLAGNVDVDNNGFNDLAIGSFNSSQTIVLRSKPIITVSGRIKSTLNKLPLDLEAFSIESCVSFNGGSSSQQVKLHVNVSADVNFRPHRIQLQLDNQRPDSLSNFVEYNVDVRNEDEVCSTISARVPESLDSSAEPVVIRQVISIQGENEGRIKKRVVEINPDGSSYISGEAYSAFCKTCPMINTGKPNQVDLMLPLAVRCGDDDRCLTDLRLDVTFRDVSEDGFMIGSSPSLIMDVTLTNYRDTALAPAVLISWERLKLKRIPPDCSKHSEQRNLVTFKCNLGRFLEENASANVSLEFDVSSFIVQDIEREDRLLFNVTATTASDMLHPESKTQVVPLLASTDVHIGGSKYLDVFNMDTLSPFLVFKHIYEVSADGPSPVGNVEIVFDIPVNLTTMTEVVVNVRGVTADHSKGGDVNCQATKGHFVKSAVIKNEKLEEDDPDFDAAGIGGLLPKDKEVSKASNSTLVESNTLLIHCDSPFVACMEVTCKASVYWKGSTSLISIILDVESDTIRSLMKDHKVSAVQVESKGRLVLPDVVKDIQPLPNKPDDAVSVTLIEREGYKPISKWIYILAVVIGILILVCVGFCLYACGCFEDKSKKLRESGDVIDGSEEIVPLQEKPGSSEQQDIPTDTNGVYIPLSPDTHESMRSPSVDATDPPEFIPMHPPIVEESEEDNDEGDVNINRTVET